MKKYEEYRESGIDWLGRIPAHWGVTNLKRVTDFINGAAFKPEDWQTEGIPIVRIQNLNGNDVFNCIKPEQEVKESCHLFGGELLFSWSGNVGTSFGPFMWEREGLAYLNQHIFKLDNYQLDQKYFYWLLKGVTKYIESKTHGIIGMVHVTKPELGAVPIPNISLPEQRAIAAYLDHKTAKLDTLLAQKEALLRKLHQKRQALINEAVTRGLDPDAPRKPSGVAWLGDVPAHWGVKALKYLLAEPMMYGANEAAELDDRSLPRYIRITDFGQDGKLRDETFKSLPHEVAKDYLLRNGDILFARSGATVGKTFFFSDYEGQACFAGYLIKGTFDTEKVLPEFVYLYTKSGLYENWKNSIFIQSTIQNISAEKYKALLLAVPSIKEQQEIIDWLEQRNKPINEATTAIHIQIQILKAYRQSLISEVVTGKVDVRTALPALAPTPAPSEQASQLAPPRPEAGGQLGLF